MTITRYQEIYREFVKSTQENVSIISGILTLLLVMMSIASNAQPVSWFHEWPNTDFSLHSVDFGEIISGGPPRDGIPAIQGPEMRTVDAESSLEGTEPVMTLEITGSIPRTYPIRYLLWHEIVNDTIDGVSIAITYCPLCNSGIFFDRQLGNELLTFGVTGKLRNSDMIMYDRETESWWQQATGIGIVGEHTGIRLTMLAGWIESWDEYRKRNPNGFVMVEPNFSRKYGINPYTRYDSSLWPFLYTGEAPPYGINALERVVRVGERAWLLKQLRKAGTLEQYGLTFTWTSGQASPLDSAIVANGKNIGSIRVRDTLTGNDLPHDVLFAFAYQAFFPEGEWILFE